MVKTCSEKQGMMVQPEQFCSSSSGTKVLQAFLSAEVLTIPTLFSHPLFKKEVQTGPPPKKKQIAEPPSANDISLINSFLKN